MLKNHGYYNNIPGFITEFTEIKYFQYYDIFDTIATLCPNTEISLRTFDRQFLKSGDIFTDFIEMIEPALDPAAFRRPPGVVNASLRLEEYETIRALNALGRSDLVERLVVAERMITIEERIRLTNYYYRHDVRELVATRFIPRNADLVDRFLTGSEGPLREYWLSLDEVGPEEKLWPGEFANRSCDCITETSLVAERIREMKVIKASSDLLRRIQQDRRLSVSDSDEFERRFDELNELFHSHFSEHIRPNYIENAKYHKWRYIELCREKLSGTILDVGNDKPFLSYYLNILNPEAAISTISFDIPDPVTDLIAVDIEQEPLPFDSSTIDKILLTEVLEHLWRDPAYAVFEINRVLKIGGELFLTTPNACELHAIVCILWQSNPNQRNQFYESLESGHLHVWSANELRILLESNGFEIAELSSFDAYRYTQRSGKLIEFVKEVSPHVELMGESLLARARKATDLEQPVYDVRLFPSGRGVQFAGALRSFAEKHFRP